jgi:hypothetical protein
MYCRISPRIRNVSEIFVEKVKNPHVVFKTFSESCAVCEIIKKKQNMVEPDETHMVKVKVNFILYHTTKAQIGSRGSALLFL